jgi:YidC/Oxa1 family membrane protein insertase
MSDQKNFLYAFLLSFGIFFAWDHFFSPTKQPAPVVTPTEIVPVRPDANKPLLDEENNGMVVDRQKAINGQRVQLNNGHIKGSINLNGGALDDLTLTNYKTSIDQDAPCIDLLNPKQTKDFYYIDFSFLTDENIEKPTAHTLWTAPSSSVTLTPQNPVTISFENSQNIRFERVYSIDDQYLITVRQKVMNSSNMPINIQSKAFIKRQKPDLKETSYILHEGAVGYIDKHLVERDYEKLADKKNEEIKSKGGWIGFSDKYWLVALLSNPDAQSTFSLNALGNDQFQTSLKQEQKSLEPGEAIEQSLYIYAGPKKLALLDEYEKQYNVKNLDLAIDFGWFYFLTKPLFQFLDWLYKMVGNFGIAILIMTLLSKILLFPLANKSYYSMGKMKKLNPQMEELKKRYDKDPVKLQQEIMALYKREKVNPLSGCLPMLIQAPIFFCLYKVLYISIEMRHAPFYGWIKDLSSKDPTSVFNLFGLLPWQTPDFLTIGLLPLIMGATMLWQQRLNPQPVDPTQAKMMLLMPLFFTYIFASFPAGLVIYWTFSNILSIGQQQMIMNMASKQKS